MKRARSGRARRRGFARLRGGRPRKQRGYALIDVLVALMISSIALLAVLGGIALSARTARASRQRLLEEIAARNRYASEQRLSFVQKTAPQ
jgi:Tfp pilus assembly protein PilV